MKSLSSFVICCLVVLGLTACSKVREEAQGGTAWCFTCHSETTALGIKIKWAEAGYEESRHGAGALSPTLAPLPVYGLCSVVRRRGCRQLHLREWRLVLGGGWRQHLHDVRHREPDPVRRRRRHLDSVHGSGGVVPTLRAGGGQPEPPEPHEREQLHLRLRRQRLCGPDLHPPASATQSGCESAGGQWLGPKTTVIGFEREGSRSFNLNGYGCQMCHTQEGFRKRVSGAYNTASLNIGLDPGTGVLSWDPAAWATQDVATPSAPSGTTYSRPWLPADVSPLAADTILNPSPLGCFGCHTPHGIGTPDGVTLPQTVPAGTSTIHTQAGGVWGSSSTPVGQGAAPKERGHICASCHQIRMNQYSSLANLLEQTIKGPALDTTGGPSTATTFSFSNPHDSPVADMILGEGGAEYVGTVAGTAGTFAFAGAYGSSAHKTTVGADCVSCHMASDYAEIDVVSRFGLSPAVNGHSFANKGIVFGNARASAIGCGSTGCHGVVNVNQDPSYVPSTFVVATTVGGSGVTPSPSLGYLQAGTPLFLYGTGGYYVSGAAKNFVDSAYHLKVNELLMKLANPDTGCSGKFKDAAAASVPAKTVTFTYAYGINWGPEAACSPGGSNLRDASAVGTYSTNTNDNMRLAKAAWNFGFLKNEQSWGVHNTKYALELLYDSCMDLAVMAGLDCQQTTGATVGAGRCVPCEGKYVTTRP